MKFYTLSEIMQKYNLTEDDLREFGKENYPRISDLNILASLYVSEKVRERPVYKNLTEFADAVNEHIKRYTDSGGTASKWFNGVISVVFSIKSNNPIKYQGCPICRRKIMKDVNGEAYCPIHNEPAETIVLDKWIVTDGKKTTVLIVGPQFVGIEPGKKYKVDVSYNAETDRLFINDIMDETGRSLKKVVKPRGIQLGGSDVVGTASNNNDDSQGELFESIDNMVPNLNSIQKEFLINLIRTLNVKYANMPRDEVAKIADSYAFSRGFRKVNEDGNEVYIK